MAGVVLGGPFYAMAGLGLERKPHRIPLPPSTPKQDQSRCENANRHWCLKGTGTGKPRVSKKVMEGKIKRSSQHMIMQF